MAIKFLSVATVLGLAIITPVLQHFESGEPVMNDPPNLGIDSMIFEPSKNGPKKKQDTSFYWMHVVFVYVFTALMMFFLYQSTKKVIRVRQDYLGSQSTITDRTIRLSGIPPDLRNEKDLKTMVERLGMGKVESVTICRDWSDLDKLMDERAALLRKLEEVWTVYFGTRRVERNTMSLPFVQPSPPGPYPTQESNNEIDPLVNHADPTVPYARTRPSVQLRHGFLKIRTKHVDAINYFTTQLRALDNKIRETRKKDFKATPMAFVTMDSVASAVCIFMF